MTVVLDRHPSPAAEVGLHGQRFDTALVRCAATELVGTWALVLAITSVAVAASLERPIAGTPYDSLTIPLIGGSVLVALAACLGPISGAHLNPAVTIGLAATGRMPWNRVAAYVAAQGIGAVLAALTVWMLQGSDARLDAALGAPGPAIGVEVWRVGVVEAIGTLLLVLVIVTVAGTRPSQSSLAPLAIGFALAAAIAVTGPITGAGLNPARALGPMLIAGKFNDWWIYLVAPVAAAALGAWAGARLTCDLDCVT